MKRRAIDSEREAFFMRITGPGDYRYEGADLGILITRGRSMDDNFRLNIRARDWIRGIKSHYDGKPIVTTPVPPTPVTMIEKGLSPISRRVGSGASGGAVDGPAARFSLAPCTVTKDGQNPSAQEKSLLQLD